MFKLEKRCQLLKEIAVIQNVIIRMCCLKKLNYDEISTEIP